jgi:hypothetical protein
MVKIKSFLAVLVFLLVSCSPCLAISTWADKDGYYTDYREEVTKSPIKPPHPEYIPYSSRAMQTTVDFESYYKVNEEGYRGEEDKLPIIPGYTENYSTRKVKPYTKEDYINIWCDGQKHVGKVDCLTDDYALSFFPLSSWSTGITRAVLRARKYSQKGVAVFYVEDMGAITGDMYEAKKWAEMWGAEVRFVSIDAEIPLEWIR